MSWDHRYSRLKDLDKQYRLHRDFGLMKRRGRRKEYVVQDRYIKRLELENSFLNYSLPIFIILHIVSFTPIKDVISLSGIFMIKEGCLVEMAPQKYDSEDLLQSLLASHSGLLAGDQIDSENPRRWILVSREVPLASVENGSARWSVDHLFIDQDAIPTIIEVKQSSDTRIRREVVGQILEYAANAVIYWPISKLKEQFEKNCELRGSDPEVELSELVEESVDAEAFWERVKTNLLAGKIRLVFVADKIPAELQRIVEFLNGQMNPAQVLAIEISQYKGSDLQAFVPRVIGQTAEAQRAKSNDVASKQWDEVSFFAELSQTSPNTLLTVQQLLNWGRNLTRIWWGKGITAGSFVPTFEHDGRNHHPFAVWTTGKLELYLSHARKKPPFDDDQKFNQLVSRLNSISGVSVTPHAKLPKIPLTVLYDAASLQSFLDTFNWYIDLIKNDR